MQHLVIITCEIFKSLGQKALWFCTKMVRARNFVFIYAIFSLESSTIKLRHHIQQRNFIQPDQNFIKQWIYIYYVSMFSLLGVSIIYDARDALDTGPWRINALTHSVHFIGLINKMSLLPRRRVTVAWLNSYTNYNTRFSMMSYITQCPFTSVPMSHIANCCKRIMWLKELVYF